MTQFILILEGEVEEEMLVVILLVGSHQHFNRHVESSLQSVQITKKENDRFKHRMESLRLNRGWKESRLWKTVRFVKPSGFCERRLPQLRGP